MTYRNGLLTWTGGCGGGSWGSITGTLSAQTDLQTALNGKQPLATVLTNTTAAFTTAQESKLAGVASGATANASDAALRDRATHTGTQAAGTITGLATVATSGSAADLTGNLAVARLNGGTGASGTTFWRGDGSWASPTASAAWGSITGTLSSQTDLQSALDAKQPLDSDLTAIAALTTTAFGRGFLDLADAAAGRTKLALGTAALSASGDFQPVDADLTAIAALSTTAYGRALLALADAAALTALSNTFTSSLKGLAPASGGGTSNFLRADGTWATPSGGSDPWTNLKLALDYNNALNTFANITDGTTTFTFTPAADTDWAMEARLLIWTTTATNLPRIGAAIDSGAARGYGGLNIWSPGAVATGSVHANGAWNNATGVTVVQIAAGGVLTASVPYVVEVVAHGRSGASPTAISLQMACETAAANTCFVKRGSWMRWRAI